MSWSPCLVIAKSTQNISTQNILFPSSERYSYFLGFTAKVDSLKRYKPPPKSLEAALTNAPKTTAGPAY